MDYIDCRDATLILVDSGVLDRKDPAASPVNRCEYERAVSIGLFVVADE